MAEIESGLDGFGAMLAQVMHEYQTKEIERIGELIAGGLQVKDIMRAPTKLFGYRTLMKKRLLEILNRAGQFGQAQVNAELKRQEDGRDS